MANYSGMFSETLLLAKELEQPNKAPPVFPLLLYNGQRRWNAPLDASKLFDVDTKGLEKHVLRLRLHLLEVNRFRPQELARHSLRPGEGGEGGEGFRQGKKSGIKNWEEGIPLNSVLRSEA